MRRSASASLPALLLAGVLGASAAGCAGMVQFLRDQSGSRDPEIRLACKAARPDRPSPAGASRRTVSLSVTPVEMPYLVGAVINGFKPEVDVVLRETAPHVVLLADAAELLRLEGYVVADEPGATSVALEFLALEAWQWRESVLELVHPSQADVEVQVTIVAGDGQERFIWILGEGYASDPWGWLSTDLERALDDAYCQVVEELGELFASEEFRRAVEPAAPVTDPAAPAQGPLLRVRPGSPGA